MCLEFLCPFSIFFNQSRWNCQVIQFVFICLIFLCWKCCETTKLSVFWLFSMCITVPFKWPYRRVCCLLNIVLLLVMKICSTDFLPLFTVLAMSRQMRANVSEMDRFAKIVYKKCDCWTKVVFAGVAETLSHSDHADRTWEHGTRGEGKGRAETSDAENFGR